MTSFYSPRTNVLIVELTVDTKEYFFHSVYTNTLSPKDLIQRLEAEQGYTDDDIGYKEPETRSNGYVYSKMLPFRAHKENLLEID